MAVGPPWSGEVWSGVEGGERGALEGGVTRAAVVFGRAGGETVGINTGQRVLPDARTMAREELRQRSQRVPPWVDGHRRLMGHLRLEPHGRFRTRNGGSGSDSRTPS